MLAITMQRRHVLGILGTALSGGCLRLEGSETTPASNTHPAYPTGLSDDGVSALLYGSHNRALDERNFHTEFTEIDLQDSNIKQQRSYDVDSPFAIGRWAYDQGGEVTMFRSSDGGLWRENLGNRFTYGEAREGYSAEQLTWRSWIQPTLRSGVWDSPEEIREDGEPLWEIETTGYETGSVPGYYRGQLEGLSASVTVGPQGIIRSVTAEFEGVRPDIERYNVRFEYSVDLTSRVSVSEPDWVVRAKERRPRVNAVLTDDRHFVRFTLDSGNQIEPESYITVHDETTNLGAITYVLDDPIETGETVFLYKQETEGPHQGQLARGSRPKNASPLALENEYHIWAARSVEYFGTVGL